MRTIRILCGICLISILSCSIKINKNFDYTRLITPEQVAEDVDDLKRNLEKKHYDVDWEGKQSIYFQMLDEIKAIDQPISIDSFENRIKPVINNLDDGHSRIVHQDSSELMKRNQFTYLDVTDSISYVRIGNFMDTEDMLSTLNKFRSSYNANPKAYVIIDIRSNHGGAVQNVNRALTYFVPSKTKMYHKIDVKPTSTLMVLNSKLLSAKQNLRYHKYTGKKKIKGSPSIYLWVDESIISGSMLFTYHLQENGAFVIGQTPTGLFNTFGNQYGYTLDNSKIIYTLSTARLYLTEEEAIRGEDMLHPDYVPEKEWKLQDLVEFINSLQY